MPQIRITYKYYDVIFVVCVTLSYLLYIELIIKVQYNKDNEYVTIYSHKTNRLQVIGADRLIYQWHNMSSRFFRWEAHHSVLQGSRIYFKNND